MTFRWTIKEKEELDAVAAELIEKAIGFRFFCLHGEMGAGKTTFVKALCRSLGVEEEVSSPSFSIVNEYTDANGKPVYHMDFYRLKRIEEAYDLGYENYFYSPYYCFVEWPDKVESLLNLQKADIFIVAEGNFRVITLMFNAKP